MRRIGHRGAKGHVAENTIASFQKAFELGCDEVETDVWLTPEGRLVISHDAPPADAKLTLSEVLDFCRGKMAVNVELKAEASESRARDTHAAGLRVNVWTVNDPAEASRLREWGVDGVMSDYPERVPKE